MNESPLSLAIVGSINLDMVARVKAFPRDGETISDAVLDRHPGGKGGNQAVAAALKRAAVIRGAGFQFRAVEVVVEVVGHGVSAFREDRWRTASYSSTAAEVDTLRESPLPSMGMPTVRPRAV